MVALRGGRALLEKPTRFISVIKRCVSLKERLGRHEEKDKEGKKNKNDTQDKRRLSVLSDVSGGRHCDWNVEAGHLPSSKSVWSRCGGGGVWGRGGQTLLKC